LDPVFRSKVDLWLVALIVGVPVLVIEFMLEDAGIGDQTADLLAIALVMVVLAFFLWLYLSTRYTITSQSLLVKSGPFSWVVPLREITAIEPTRNAASSPALSLDRLLIRYGGGDELMISPSDKAGFMTAIKQRLKT
jgi:hypothetical protein